MELIKANWPLLVIIAYFAFKQIKTLRLKKMLPALRNEGAIFIDVRSEGEFTRAHAEGTINIPLQTINAKSSELPKDKNIILCCASGTRSSMARQVLRRNGFKKVYNAGSWTNLRNLK